MLDLLIFISLMFIVAIFFRKSSCGGYVQVLKGPLRKAILEDPYIADAIWQLYDNNEKMTKKKILKIANELRMKD